MDEKPLKIMVIDDSQNLREMLKKLLEAKGFPGVITAADGEEGLEKIQGSDVDVVFCDLLMPKMDGITFLKKLRQFDLKTETIIMTGHSDMDKCVEALELNACGYIIKPFDMEEISQNIARAKRRIEERKEILKKALQDKRKSP